MARLFLLRAVCYYQNSLVLGEKAPLLDQILQNTENRIGDDIISHC